MRLEEFPGSYQEGLAYAQAVLDSLIAEWGLELTLKTNGRLKTTYGYWWVKEKDAPTIATYCLIDRPAAVILDTVAHEYAHAVDYSLRGRTDHSPVWREVAELCGAKPRAASSVEEQVEMASQGSLQGKEDIVNDQTMGVPTIYFREKHDSFERTLKWLEQREMEPVNKVTMLAILHEARAYAKCLVLEADKWIEVLESEIE